MKRTAATLLGCAMASLALISGCDGGGSSAPAPAPTAGGAAPAAAAAPSAAPAGGGAYDPASATATIVVKATAKGSVPAMRPLQITGDTVCVEAHKDPVLGQSIVSKDGKLANVIAYASKGSEGKSYPSRSDAMVLDQKGCMYHPHVFTVMVNQPILIKNSDPTNHNIHALPKKGGGNADFNESQVAGAKDITQTFVKPEVAVKIKCDVHGWMEAHAEVFAHPFHGVTGEDGTTKLKVPPGDYEISVWQESDKLAKPAAQKVTVGKDETKEIEFVFDVK